MTYREALIESIRDPENSTQLAQILVLLNDINFDSYAKHLDSDYVDFVKSRLDKEAEE